MPLKYYFKKKRCTVCGYRKKENILTREISVNKYVSICKITAKYNPVSLKLRLVLQS